MESAKQSKEAEVSAKDSILSKEVAQNVVDAFATIFSDISRAPSISYDLPQVLDPHQIKPKTSTPESLQLTFHPFPRLPQELRIKIWKAAFPGSEVPHYVHVRVERSSTDQNSARIKHCIASSDDDTVAKIFMLTSHESNLAYTETYQQILSEEDRMKLALKTSGELTLQGRINFDRDILMINIADVGEFWECKSWRDGLAQVKHLALLGCGHSTKLTVYFGDNGVSLWDLASIFPALKQLSLVLGKGSGDKEDEKDPRYLGWHFFDMADPTTRIWRMVMEPIHDWRASIFEEVNRMWFLDRYTKYAKRMQRSWKDASRANSFWTRVDFHVLLFTSKFRFDREKQCYEEAEVTILHNPSAPEHSGVMFSTSGEIQQQRYATIRFNEFYADASHYSDGTAIRPLIEG